MKVYQNSRCIASNIKIADTFWLRFKGLMGQKTLRDSEGLLLKKCGSIHTCFMRFPIDVIYFDEDFRVLDKETVKPWKCGKIVKKAKHVLELPEGYLSEFEVGIRMELE